MPIDARCQWYEDMADSLRRVRDFLSGEWRVKKEGERYLPKLSGQDTGEYEAYKDRTTFLNATARTHEGLLGQVFRKDPRNTVPEPLSFLLEDADLQGNTLYKYERRMVSEVLAAGRAVTLVDFHDEEERHALVFYEREQLLNWRRARVGGRTKLVLATLLETRTAPMVGVGVAAGAAAPENAFDAEVVERVRVLFLDDAGAYNVHVYEREAADGAGQGKKTVSWTLVERRVPQRGGRPLEDIPLVFHDASPHCGECPRPPLDDLASLNLNHYRLSADLNHGLRFSSLPTPWAAGFEVGKTLTIGSSQAWVTDNVQAKVGYLEASGAGLGQLSERVDKLESSMATMGARLLETQKREAESAEALGIRQAGESSVLSSLANACSDSLTQALKIAVWWAAAGEGTPAQVPDEQCSVELNTDFVTAQMTGAEVVAFVSAWVQRGISRKTLFDVLKKGEVIPAERTLEEEVALIDGEGPSPGMDLGEGGSE